MTELLAAAWAERQSTPAHESLRRGLQIMALVQDCGRTTVAEIADAVGLPLSTTYRYVTTLRQTGFIVDDDGHIVPGSRLAEHSSEEDHLVSLARPILSRLRSLTGLTVLILVRVHTMALCLDWAPASPRHHIFFSRGQVRPIGAGGSALPLLAFAPPAIIQAVLERPVRGTTAAAPTTADLENLLPQIRATGVSISRGHITPGMTSVGVPVLVAGRCLCSISLVGSDQQLPADSTLDMRIEQIQAAAAEISAALPDAIAREDWSNADN